ncbi:PREDICTED: hormone-sensitive lipase isoform X2 [Dinoponera quadriceps]|uniref:Hormone-sensitive lipase isoform X2 n=1 Tax=Dinoponera quadriceps TaxID=609295 RepID=A0A6P3X1C5_DINQU|nr:PREDICTED: hormone-sensitive lipase isoform X2 [Dinoponera quadriceps]
MSLNDDFDRPFEDSEPLQWGALREICCANVDYFASHQDANSVRIKAALLAILDHLDQLRPLYREVAKFAVHFDYDEENPGNGYRSFLSLIDKAILHCNVICQEIFRQKNSILSRKSYHMREIEACSQLLASLYTCLQHLKTLYAWSTEVISDGKLSLFPPENHTIQELLSQMGNINQYCFYGRCLGFQFCDSLKHVFKTITFGMASYSEVFYSNGTLLGRWSNFVKYLLDPEARARRVVSISQHADISFCQAFWFLNESELLPRLPSIKKHLAINQVISIPPEELILPTVDGGTVSIPIPNSHIGKKPIHVRLLSSKRRLGMVGSGGIGGELLGLSDGLIIHSHGGGFVAQTSRSHEVYLRSWAVKLGVPILSIDYSLAPEAPYPRALEEVLYAYAWALKHANTLLGSTVKKVILVGDSAGGNLNLGVTLKCIQLNIRKPDGMFLAYAPVLVEFVPSPSRMLCFTDPLLPFGFMLRCLKAYVATDKKVTKEQEVEECAKSDTESFAEMSESDLIALALSPNGDGANGAQKLVSLPSDSTLNSVSLTEVDGSDKSWSLFGWSFGGKDNKETRELDVESGRSPLEELTFAIPRDPFLSPYLAPDDTLVHLPPIKLLSLQLDPCLDDSVMFARKLRSLGNKVTLDILSGLPHGFLNLILVSKEAADATDLCATRIKELLDL